MLLRHWRAQKLRLQANLIRASNFWEVALADDLSANSQTLEHGPRIFTVVRLLAQPKTTRPIATLFVALQLGGDLLRKLR